ncbi:MAG: hypothetical protein EA382_06160 [Spirochaetaceae bacterium]|nr:MAG: hypothetical protein EA382_06160 [Spirochaetaceae bacterium]
MREFHVRRDARERYGLRDSLYAISGNVILADLAATRRLAHEMNQRRDLVHNPASAIRSGELHAMGLIDEVMHHVVDLYREEHGIRAMGEAYDALGESIGRDRLDSCLDRFAELFPPTPVYRGERTLEEFYNDLIDERPAREVVLEELLMLWLENDNPAFSPFVELFDDSDLQEATRYGEVIDALSDFFRTRPPFGPDRLSLIDMLREPARRYPDNIEQQLRFIRERWGSLMGDYLSRLLRGVDLIREESNQRFGGPGPSHVYSFATVDDDVDGEPEGFSPDRDWMPEVVIMAKSALVWLDQLSKQHARDIRRLDQIPDEELDRLASWGMNGLWLIGLWQRSSASRRIKNIMGNHDAEASAYALYDYEIADELGGWPALEDLRTRCRARGIRVASDMVPNHVGIDGRWVIEHPDWFIHTDHPPFPAYSFSGENLSSHPGVGIYLEDHYYSRSDAAVVFKRVDLDSGHERFIYHGNDGTSMPWNDTAQLDYLKAEVREAVIQTILHVARSFSIIRFDAAMTLAKKHIQRLWYPTPGSGGDIASRAERGLTQEEFDSAIPTEFWREVVDRVAQEVPDTLLLAEAFWMMEGYFVRTLGMHRVYNSAFMNMLKNEENDKYRQTIRNTIEFDKDILKRFVNFMNNPDEETAVAQFGTGDKYFGVCTLMATMPGLPMFGHGQIEGFTEKYGMEYRRAYLNEQPNRELIGRHEREIFPLLRRRHVFAGVEDFLLYDLHGHSGVNENVFAYSNRSGDDRALVLFNNAYERAAGWIRQSCEYAEKNGGGGRDRMSRDIATAFGLRREFEYFTLFRDQRSGHWFIRRSAEIHDRGLFVDLGGYQTHVFTDFYEVRDTATGSYAQLADQLAGDGVPDVDRAIRDIALKPLHDCYAAIANSATYHTIGEAVVGKATIAQDACERIRAAYERFLVVAADYQDPDRNLATALKQLCGLLHAAEQLAHSNLTQTGGAKPAFRTAIGAYTNGLKDRSDRVDLLVTWLLLQPIVSAYDYPVGVCDDWELIRRSSIAFSSGRSNDGWIQLVRVLVAHGDWWERGANASTAAENRLRRLFDELLADEVSTTYLGLNEYDGVVYFRKEAFDELRWWLRATAMIALQNAAAEPQEFVRAHKLVDALEAAQNQSNYRIDTLLDLLSAADGKPGTTDGEHTTRAAASALDGDKPIRRRKKSS